MPKKTYTQINSVTLASSASSVSFSGIPQNFRDLVAVANYGVTGGEIFIRFNSDSGNNYNTLTMRGGANSSIITSNFTANSIRPVTGTGEPTTTTPLVTLNIMDYSATDKHKTTLVRTNNVATSSTGHVQAQANRWASNNPITEINFVRDTESYTAGSTFTLYGIEA